MKPTSLVTPALSTTRSTKITKKKKRKKKPKRQLVQYKSENLTAHQHLRRQPAEAAVAVPDQRRANQPGKKRLRKPRRKNQPRKRQARRAPRKKAAANVTRIVFSV